MSDTIDLKVVDIVRIKESNKGGSIDGERVAMQSFGRHPHVWRVMVLADGIVGGTDVSNEIEP